MRGEGGDRRSGGFENIVVEAGDSRSRIRCRRGENSAVDDGFDVQDQLRLTPLYRRMVSLSGS